MNFNPPDTVLLYGPVWDAPSRMSKHHLAMQWSQTRRVLYIEAPFNPFSFFTRPDEAWKLWERFRQGPVQVARNLWIQSYPYLLPYRGRNWQTGGRGVNRLNQWWVRQWFRRTLNSLRFDYPLYVAGHAGALDLLPGMPRSALLYHCSDDFTLVPSFPQSFASVERKLMDRADAVVTTAETLSKAKAPFCREVWTIPNGADVEHFLRTRDDGLRIAADLKELKPPRIGYIGTVFRWIHQGWVGWVARKEPDWNFIFVGPVETDISELRGLSNVHFLGPRHYRVLPSYLKGFDVATIPFHINEVTRRASPIKFYEYLASGLPIVATRLPELEPYQDVSFLVGSRESFRAALRRAVNDRDAAGAEKRISRVQTHSWRQRAGQFDRVIAHVLAQKNLELATHSPGDMSTEPCVEFVE